MKRRIALKNMTLAAGGLLMLPAWARGWSRDSVSFSPFLTPPQQDRLAALVDTIIPATDTPGAKDLEVHLFVQKMVTDCYEAEVQEDLAKGLETIEAMAQQSHGSSFSACNRIAREALLLRLEDPLNTELPLETPAAPDTQPPDFFALVKELTIRGYMTSEYVMTHHTDYTMAPGHFYGCVPVTTS